MRGSALLLILLIILYVRAAPTVEVDRVLDEGFAVPRAAQQAHSLDAGAQANAVALSGSESAVGSDGSSVYVTYLDTSSGYVQVTSHHALVDGGGRPLRLPGGPPGGFLGLWAGMQSALALGFTNTTAATRHEQGTAVVVLSALVNPPAAPSAWANVLATPGPPVIGVCADTANALWLLTANSIRPVSRIDSASGAETFMPPLYDSPNKPTARACSQQGDALWVL